MFFMVNLCQRTRRKEMTCFLLLIIMEFSIYTLEFVKIFLCQLTRWKERNMIGNITRLYLSISLPRMPKTCKMNMYFHWVKYLYLSVSLPCMPRTCEIINDKHKGDKDKVGKSKNENNQKDMDKGDKIENDFIYLYHFPACRRPAK